MKYYHKDLKSELQVAEGYSIKSYDNIANLYSTLKDYLKALEYHQKALKINSQLEKEKHIFGVFVGKSYSNVGEAYKNLVHCIIFIDYFRLILFPPLTSSSFAPTNMYVTCVENAECRT